MSSTNDLATFSKSPEEMTPEDYQCNLEPDRRPDKQSDKYPDKQPGRRHINQKMSGDRELWNGYYQSVKPTTSRTLVNIDVSSLVFYTEQPMVDLFSQLLNIPLIASEIVQLQILATHTATYHRKYRIRELAKSAETQTFVLEDDNGVALRECTVAEFFSEKYNIQLAYPHLPCLKVGKMTKNTFLPLEVCFVVAGQQCYKQLTEDQSTQMIGGIAPNARQKEIEEIYLFIFIYKYFKKK